MWCWGVTLDSHSKGSEFYPQLDLPKIEKNEMGGACGAYGGGEMGAQGVGGET